MNNNRCRLLSTCYMPATMLSNLCRLYFYGLITTQDGWRLENSLVQGHSAYKWWSQYSNSGSLPPELKILTMKNYLSMPGRPRSASCWTSVYSCLWRKRKVATLEIPYPCPRSTPLGLGLLAGLYLSTCSLLPSGAWLTCFEQPSPPYSSAFPQQCPHCQRQRERSSQNPLEVKPLGSSCKRAEEWHERHFIVSLTLRNIGRLFHTDTLLW